MGSRSRHGHRAGFTLVEMMVALALLGSALASLLLVGSTSTRLCVTGITNADLEANARRAIECLSRELATARAGSIDALPASPLWLDVIDFDQMDAMRAGDGRVSWSPSRVELRRAPGEIDDGVDNDGNGLVDEGELVLVHDAASSVELTTVLARGVREYLEGERPNGLDDNANGLIDERGAAFVRVDGELRLYLTLEARATDGFNLTRTLTTTAWSRN